MDGRTHSRRLLLALLATAASVWPASPVRAESSSRRFAVVVANNEGSADTRPLRYAHQDATRLREVLLRLGEVAPADAVLLLERQADEVRGAIDALEPRIAQAAARGERPVLVFYYSGHAKDGALRLGGSILPLEELKWRMSRSAAAVRIGLLDSCRSGVITRTKGARKAPAFEVDLGAMQAARGLVLLASSAADEDSQESDELGGSFFSHHLASGLMGGADSSGDGRVSLSEAYAYAYDRTVADTADTAAGPQHPTFSYDLAGNGDVILTDVGARREGVVLPAEAPAGSYFLVDARGAIAAEIAKAAGVERRVALSPGPYKVRRRLPDRLRVGDLSVKEGETVTLSEAKLKDAPFSDDPVKGVHKAWQPERTRFGMSLTGGYQYFLAGPFPSMPVLGLEASVRASFVWSFDFGYGFGSSQVRLGSGDPLPYDFNELGLGVSMTREWAFGRLAPFVGARLAVILLHRDFEDAGVPQQSYFAMTPGLVAGLRLKLASRLALMGRARGHYLYYNVDSQQSLGYLEGALVLSVEL
ncbi:MAG: caspase family protein [Deltaproteobacteria bacterium]|nr:caspase family protein [Deltaproteobacteria bacterium]